MAAEGWQAEKRTTRDGWSDRKARKLGQCALPKGMMMQLSVRLVEHGEGVAEHLQWSYTSALMR